MPHLTTLQTDVAIIGVGTAGMSAYKAARKHTDRVLTIEAAEYGTTCARVGCMPSKLLIAPALTAHRARQAGGFGLEIARVHVDGVAVMQRVRAERDRFAQFSVDEVLDWPAEHRIRGHARFTAPRTLQVDEHTRIEARSIVIATGSSPIVPDDLRQSLGDRLIVNDDVFAWQDLPQSVAVMGTGVIGLELAFALHFLGVRVRLLGRSGKVGPATDPAIAAECAALVQDTLPCALQSRLLQARRTASGPGAAVELRFESDGEEYTESFDYLLMATGRKPNLSKLNLQAADIATDDKGMPAFDPLTRQIEDTAIFIAGDANQHHPVLHEASDDGHAAGHNAARYPDVRAFQRRAGLNIVFSHPQIALAGRHHRQLTQAGVQFATGKLDFKRQGRSRIELQNQGLLHVYGEQGTGRFLGAEMVGPAAEHLAHLLAWAVQQEQTVAQMLACPFYHPVVEEGLRTALRDLQAQLKNHPSSS